MNENKGGWKYGIHMAGQKEPSFNACVFATRAEAMRAGHELLSRWTAPKLFTVHRTADEPNYAFPADADRPISMRETAG